MYFQGSVGNPEDYFLFGCIFEANMIDRRLGNNKPIKFELSIGKYELKKMQYNELKLNLRTTNKTEKNIKNQTIFLIIII